MMMFRALACAGAGVLLLAAAACGGDDNTDGAADGTPQAQTPPSQVTRTPPAVGAQGEVRSDDAGYSAKIPEGWTAQASLAPPGTVADMFVGPSAGAIPPSITVRCAEQPASDAPVTVLTAIARVDPAATLGPPLTVAGHAASVVTFTAGMEQLRVQRRDVQFVDGRCHWTLTLTAAVGTLEEFAPAFDGFIASFEPR